MPWTGSPPAACYAAYCLAEAILERATRACEAHAAALRIDAAPEGGLVLALDHDCCGCHDEVADSRFDLAVARVEIASGAVHEVRANDRELVRMVFPELG